MKKQQVSFVISEEEIKMLEKVVIFEPFLLDNLRRIKKEGKDRWIAFDAYDLFDAISALEYSQSFSDSPCGKSERSPLITKLKNHLNLVREPGQELGI